LLAHREHPHRRYATRIGTKNISSLV
jgi:hypothetical protein